MGSFWGGGKKKSALFAICKFGGGLLFIAWRPLQSRLNGKRKKHFKGGKKERNVKSVGLNMMQIFFFLNHQEKHFFILPEGTSICTNRLCFIPHDHTFEVATPRIDFLPTVMLKSVLVEDSSLAH